MSKFRMGRPVFFLGFLGIFLISSPAFPQVSDSTPKTESQRPNSLKPGAWALQFQISDQFRSFSGLQGFGLSLKYHFTRAGALRFGVGLGLSTSDFDETSRRFLADTVRGKGAGTAEGDIQSVDFAAQYVLYVTLGREINLFLGTGPLVRYAHSRREGTDNSSSFGSTGWRNYIRKETQWNVGASGLFGAEWFANKSISLHAEYGISLTYQSQEFTGNGIETSSDPYRGTQTYSFEVKDNSHSLSFSLANVKFGLSVYF